MPPETTADRWFYKGPDGKRGPLSIGELRKHLMERTIPADSPVWRHGLETWTPAIAIPELRSAVFADAASRPCDRAPRLNRFVILAAALLTAACVAAVMMGRPAPPVARQPTSLREQLIVIGRSGSLEAMPTVIKAVTDPDVAVASTAITVAEGLLGIRYADADRNDPAVLAGKITDDWKATQEQMRRRLVGKEFKTP